MAKAPSRIDVDGEAALNLRLTWDVFSETALDLQAVVVDNRGRIVDVVCHNNMKGTCSARVLSHSSGQVVGACCTQEVTTMLKEMPAAVHLILILVCYLGEGAPYEALELSFVAEQPQWPMAHRLMTLEPPWGDVTHSSILVASLVRARAGHWQLRREMQALPNTEHFMDALGSLHQHVVAEIPHVSPSLQVAIPVEKGGVLAFPSDMKTLRLGLGYSGELGRSEINSAAILFTSAGEALEAVFQGNPQISGDHSQAGAVSFMMGNRKAGHGDSEIIHIRLDQLGELVHSIYVCMHITAKLSTTGVQTFADVGHPYCRACAGGVEGAEICRYTVAQGAGDAKGVILCRLQRSICSRGGEKASRWSFCALGISSQGTRFTDAIGDMANLVELDPRTLQIPAEGKPDTLDFWNLQRNRPQCDCSLQ